MTEERRKAVRHKTLKGARIVFNNGWASIVCTVRNISDGGAKLQVESVVDVPSTFTLVFDDGSPSRECYVRWTMSATPGVGFK